MAILAGQDQFGLGRAGRCAAGERSEHLAIQLGQHLQPASPILLQQTVLQGVQHQQVLRFGAQLIGACAAEQPQAVDGRQAGLLAFAIDGQIKGQHLELIDQPAPGAGMGVLRPPVIQIALTDQLRRGGVIAEIGGRSHAPVLGSQVTEGKTCAIQIRGDSVEQCAAMGF